MTEFQIGIMVKPRSNTIVCKTGEVNKLKEVFILSYGCDLDHNNIDFLVNERLMPYSVDRAYRRNEMPP